jgi:hypothetical protein
MFDTPSQKFDMEQYESELDSIVAEVIPNYES